MPTRTAGAIQRRSSGSRRAYEQVLAELERQRVPDADKTEPVVDKSAQSPRRDRGSKPPDRNWEPDFVILDDPPQRTRPPRPRDPNWDPDLILLDDPPSDEVTTNAADGDAGKPYHTIFQRISSKSARENSTWEFGWIYAISMLILLILIVFLSFTLDSTNQPPFSRPIRSGGQHTIQRYIDVPARPSCLCRFQLSSTNLSWLVLCFMVRSYL